MKILLAGTPIFAVPIFEKIINNFKVVGIITQPDARTGRKMKISFSPVKKLAQQYKIKLFQPEKIDQLFDQLSKLKYDYMLTAAFGQYIPERILNLSKIASLNIHASLLPKYRGAAPIQHAIWNGDKITGLNLIYMTKKMDGGHILKKAILKIENNDNSGTIFKKMSLLATKNIVSWLKDLYSGNFTEIIQDESLITKAPKLNKKAALMDLNMNFEEFNNKIRAFNPNPGAYVIENNKRIKIFELSKKVIINAPKIQLKDGEVYLKKYQKEGKKIVEL